MPPTMQPTAGFNWFAIDSDARFRSLHKRKSRFLWGLMAFAVVYYFLLPIGAAYFTDLFKVKVWGADQLRPGVRAVAVHRRLGHRLVLCAQGRRVRRDGRGDRARRRHASGGDAGERHGQAQIVLSVGAALAAVAASPAFAQAVSSEWRMPHLRRVRRDHRRDDVGHLHRGEAREDRRRLLRRRRRGIGPAERLGDRRRLSVGGVVPRHRRA